MTSRSAFLSTVLALTTSPLAAECPPSKPPSNVVVEAGVATAGPYGQLWEVSITAEGDAYVVILNGIEPLGHLCGRFLFGKAGLEELRGRAVTELFYELPELIEPTEFPFHAPDFRLTFARNGETKTVKLYNPAAVPAGPQRTHFFAIWDAIFEKLPVRPTW